MVILHDIDGFGYNFMAASEVKITITNERNINIGIYYIDANLKIIEEYVGKMQLYTFKETSLKCAVTEFNKSAVLFNVEFTVQWPESYDALAAAGIVLEEIESFSISIKNATGLHAINTLTGSINPDPYYELYWGKEKIGSGPVKKNTIEPIWNESLVLPFKPSLHRFHSFVIEVYHSEMVG